MMVALTAQLEPTPWEFEPGMATASYGLSNAQILFIILAGIGVAVLFGLWGRSKAENHDVDPWLGFLAGFFLACLGVRIVPLLRRDRLVFQPRPRPVINPPGPGVGPPPAPPPAPPTPVVDAQGFLACPACGARVKAGRKACMACGAPLPIV